MHSRVYSKDEELGKRDDDFRPRRTTNTSTLLKPWRWRKRRIFTVVALIIAAFTLVQHIHTDFGRIDGKLVHTVSSGPHQPVRPEYGQSIQQREPVEALPRSSSSQDEVGQNHYYNGPIKFYRLGSSLRSIARTMGTRLQNRNVMFAVSSLRSAANLMPMACEMAKWDRNYVHMVFMGRDSHAIDDILEINGVNRDDCTVYFHDARCDHSEQSTDIRVESAIAGAMKHINDYMHPQAIIMDDSTIEDEIFTRVMRKRSQDLGRPLIEIPAGSYEQFMWVTRLDSGSLASWFRPNINILVHAPPESAGGLIRLVRSLKEADYKGLKVPRLTIELPSKIQPAVRRFIEALTWPPSDRLNPTTISTLTIHHRIPHAKMTSEQASVRFVELFYPANAADDHVLVLSPQAELSPLYLQYLHYVILEYQYSSYGSLGSADILGISLDVPSTFLNGSGKFQAPLVSQMHSRRYSEEGRYDQASTTPFLYQAPSSTASLIFGSKWASFHSFLTNRLAASHAGVAYKTKKLVSETEPAWLEYFLELCRARGWSMLHPAIPFVTVHNELSQLPEEYVRDNEGESKTSKESQELIADEEPFLTAPDPPTLKEHKESETSGSQPLHKLLPFEGDLPELPHLPHVSCFGEYKNITELMEERNLYTQLFRRQTGGCDEMQAVRKRIVHDLDTDDLFCTPGVKIEFDEIDVAETRLADQIIAETNPFIENET